MSAAQGTGFAVMTDGAIDMRTVCDTRRAAIINWLVVHGTFITKFNTDSEIEILWRDQCGASEVVHVRVSQLKTV